MIVHVVTYFYWQAYESDYTEVRGVFSTEQKAKDYIEKHSSEVYEYADTAGSGFDIESVELDKEIK